MKTSKNKGRLYLIPVGLGGENPDAFLPANVQQHICSLREFIVEQSKTARHFLKSIQYPHPFDDIRMHELDKHDPVAGIAEMLRACGTGSDVGLLSEAGAPAVADPGALVVEQAHAMGVRVVPLVGPSSILLALMASGLNGQSFVFHGYLPYKGPELASTLKKLEIDSRRLRQTQIFIEAPYRNQKLLEVLMQTLHPDTRLCIAAELTTLKEFIATRTVSEWKKSLPDLHKKPTVFLFLG